MASGAASVPRGANRPAAAKQAAEIGIFIGWAAANEPQLPSWKKGEEFERARLASLK